MGETPIPESALIGRREELVGLISTTLQAATSFQAVIDFCDRMKLPMGNAQGISNSKRLYVRERIKTLEDSQLIALGLQVAQEFSGKTYDLGEFFHLLRESLDAQPVTRLTRGKILSELDWGGMELFPAQARPVALSKLWPGKTLPNDKNWSGETYLNSEYLELCGILDCSRYSFNALLEALVHPEQRDGEDQLRLVETLNQHLRPDNYELQHVGKLSGQPIYKVGPARGGVGGSPKNIIFAADGPKPEIVFRDGINNDIEIVKNAEFCLIYNWPLNEDASAGASWPAGGKNNKTSLTKLPPEGRSASDCSSPWTTRRNGTYLRPTTGISRVRARNCQRSSRKFTCTTTLTPPGSSRARRTWNGKGWISSCYSAVAFESCWKWTANNTTRPQMGPLRQSSTQRWSPPTANSNWPATSSIALAVWK